MTWAKVDDGLYSHPKRRAAGFEALGLWVVAMSYCAHRLSDGAVTTDDVVDLCKGNRKLAVRLTDALVAAGLWEVTDDGWQFHDWKDYQPMRAQVLSERARKAEAGRKGGYRSGEARASTNGEAAASSTPRTRSDPARPSRPPSAHARVVPEPDSPSSTTPPNGLAAAAPQLAEVLTTLAAKKAAP